MKIKNKIINKNTIIYKTYNVDINHFIIYPGWYHHYISVSRILLFNHESLTNKHQL
jgi:hypothetical protein